MPIGNLTSKYFANHYMSHSDHVRLSRRSRKRFITKSGIFAEKLLSGQWTQKEYAQHVIPLESFTDYADSRDLRKSVYRRIELTYTI
ncbi:MAG: hypothetical protein H8D27_05560 [Chlorobium phaeobacteroides]|nr:hypothetical protein [Chlorobium phaeobacteroides]